MTTHLSVYLSVRCLSVYLLVGLILCTSVYVVVDFLFSSFCQSAYLLLGTRLVLCDFDHSIKWIVAKLTLFLRSHSLLVETISHWQALTILSK